MSNPDETTMKVLDYFSDSNEDSFIVERNNEPWVPEESMIVD
jgi:hypothetical protein